MAVAMNNENAPVLLVERRRGLSDIRPLRERMRSLVADSDTTPTRFVLMACALAQSAGFFLNRDCEKVYVACKYMATVMDYTEWSVLFFIYGCLKLWRIFDGRARPNTAKVINAYGACLFGGFATILVVSRWPYWILAVPYCVIALSAIWVFARTAINKERGFRRD